MREKKKQEIKKEKTKKIKNFIKSVDKLLIICYNIIKDKEGDQRSNSGARMVILEKVEKAHPQPLQKFQNL